ncbi:acyl-CoA thioesterase [Cytophaga aurantiaca]|uniref:acyl-CoA thioesterase n=1 Tax=Cytophaga aurantiaca TaxID=29530 RepID=UPI00037E0E61|nr:acyl-CoA thioesterase [Cytophaga aurantiaca]
MNIDNAVIFNYALTIREQHLDTFGHVNNATYLTLFEEARWELITQNGYGLSYIRETGLGPTILEINIKFLKELRLRQEIVIESRMISYEGKIGKIEQKMLRNVEECCIAEFTVALFSVKERKLVLPTPEWLKAIGL